MAVTSKISPNWKIVTDTPDGKHSAEASAFVINDLLEIVAKTAPLDRNRKMVIREWDAGYPMYITEDPNGKLAPYQDIMLDTADSIAWNQVVYELAHELTHFMAYHGIQQRQFKWFEETLGQMSSYFFLEKMAFAWRNSANPRKKAYSMKFAAFSETVRGNAEKVNIKDLSRAASELTVTLANNNEDRPINNYISQRILPVIKKQPAYWQAIPYLERVENASDFPEFLEKWKSVAPMFCGRVISQIAGLFE